MTAPASSTARFGQATSRLPDLLFRLGTGGFAWVAVGVVVLVGILLAASCAAATLSR